MRAIIMKHPIDPSSALLPVAGQPLLARQLEWLRDEHVIDIAIELSATDDAVTRWLDEHPALARGVRRIPSVKSLSATDIAERAQFPANEPCAVISGDLLVRVALEPLFARAREGSVVVQLRGRGDLLPGVFRIIGAPGVFAQVIPAVGWGCFVLNHRDVLELSSLTLRGVATDLLVHATEEWPGVWCSRGARIERGANVRPGVLLGPGAVICAGATVGPDVLIGADSVIEDGANLSNAIVDPDLIVGALQVRDGRIDAIGVHHLQSDELLYPIEETRLVASRRILRRAA